MTVDHEFYLSGKYYLTEREAAHYCCVSHSHFRDKRLESGIPMIQFMGKRIYRRSDLEAAIEGRPVLSIRRRR